jgi:hypothetical protein
VPIPALEFDEQTRETNGMDTHRTIEIDDRFMGEWVEFGIREMTAYLAKQARFQEFLAEREPAA